MSNQQKASEQLAIPDIMNMSSEQLTNTVVCCGDLDYKSIFVEAFGRLPSAEEQRDLKNLIISMDLIFFQDVLLEIKFGTEAMTLAEYLDQSEFYDRSYLLDTPVDMLNFDYESLISAIKLGYETY